MIITSYILIIRMLHINKIFCDGQEKSLKQYAVIKISTTKDEDGNVIAAHHVFCDDAHIFTDESLADKFCDHANANEKLSYQWRVVEFTIDI